jgi:hypothetical protein
MNHKKRYEEDLFDFIKHVDTAHQGTDMNEELKKGIVLDGYEMYALMHLQEIKLPKTSNIDIL